MAGSGKFVAIAASNTLDDLVTNPISGVVFGNGRTPYCRVSSRYTSSNNVVTGTAFCIDPGVIHARMSLQFPNLTSLKINGYTGFTGDVRVGSSVSVDEGTPAHPGTYKCTTQYSTYKFICGLLVSATI